MSRGFFITLEGGEGTGKSTQGRKLADHLRQSGRQVVLTREPGGTSQGEALRALLVRGEVGAWSPASEAMLMSAAREVHVRTVIAPALAQGAIVISDRFMDSTRVYQGIAGGVPAALISALEEAAVGTCRPDLTLVFDLSPEVGLTRASSRDSGGEDRFEKKGNAFHARLRDGFLAVAAAEPERCVMVNAEGDVEAVFARVLSAVEGRLRG